MRGQTARRIHLSLALLWGLTLYPTVMWWRESVLWVAFASIYANVVTHLGAAEGAGAREAVEVEAESADVTADEVTVSEG